MVLNCLDSASRCMEKLEGLKAALKRYKVQLSKVTFLKGTTTKFLQRSKHFYLLLISIRDCAIITWRWCVCVCVCVWGGGLFDN